MTFLRSAVFAIFAIALSWDDSSGQASPASSLSRSIQEATRVGVSRETQPSRDAHVSSSRPPRRTASTAGGRPYRVPDERRFRVRQVKVPLSLRRIACLFYLSCQSSAASRPSPLKSVQTIGKTVPESATYLYRTNSVSLQTPVHCGESAFAAKCHLSAGITGHQSFSAGRSLRIAVCNPVSKSTNVSAGQEPSHDTTLPAFATSSSRTQNGCSCGVAECHSCAALPRALKTRTDQSESCDRKPGDTRWRPRASMLLRGRIIPRFGPPP